MTIIRDKLYSYQLANILKYILRDKASPVKKFKKEVDDKIDSLIENPLMCRKSHYFEDEAYRDLAYSGYTIIYKIEEEKIIILEIF